MTSRSAIAAVFLLLVPPLPRAPREAPRPLPVMRVLSAEPADSLRHLLRGPHSGFASALRAVARDSATFHRLWAEAVRGNAVSPTTPRIDFAREMVVFAAMGVRNSTGFTISIDSVVVRGPSAEVHVKLGSAGSLCMQGMAMTNPVDIAVVRHSHEVVVFRDRHVITECKLP